MTTLQMVWFLEAARQLNFSTAAEQLYTTQSTLSRQIKAMEDELGVRLFVRSSNTVWLTPAGRKLYEGLQPICSSYDALCAEVKEADIGMLGELRLAVAEDQLFTPLLRDTILAFSQKYPRIAINIKKADFRCIHDELRSGNVDIAVSFWHNERSSSDIDCVDIAEESISLAVPKDFDHPCLAALREEDIYAVSRELPMYLLAPDYFALYADVYKHLSDLMRYGGEQAASIRYISSLSAAPQYVSLGLGMTLANESHVLSIDPQVRLCPFVDMEPLNKILCVHARHRSDITEKFLSVFEEQRTR